MRESGVKIKTDRKIGNKTSNLCCESAKKILEFIDVLCKV